MKHVVKNFNLMLFFNDFKESITDQKSIFLKRLNLHNCIKNICTNYSGILSVYELVNEKISTDQLKQFIIDNSDLDINSHNKLYEEKYPLLTQLDPYNYKKNLHHIISYINLIDKN